MSKLVIVESPAKAKTIAKFLGKGFKVVASNGHVRDLPKSQLGVDVENGFAPKYITLRGRGEVLERIRKEAKGASDIYLATDPDREGEAISWHLANVLSISDNAKCRIEFNEITAAAIKRAVKNPRVINRNLVDAQQARRILDRLVGYKISPLLWAKVKKGLSAGRVQSVATRIICDRENEIEAFVPEEYWHLDAQLLHQPTKKTFAARFYGKADKKLTLSSEDETMAVVKALKGAAYKATDVKKGQKTRHSAPPFTTSNLQQEASRKLGFTTKRTMLIAQQLYEGIEVKGKGAVGLVTYIRTDSVRVSQEALNAVRELLKNRFGEKYVPEQPNYYRGRKGAQDAHEAIRPTDVGLAPDMIKDSLTPDQFKLYRLIYNRFLASQMAAALYETLAVFIEAAGYQFRANGSRRFFDGFMAVYTEGRDDNGDEEDVLLPDIQPGEVFPLVGLTQAQCFTQPPPRYTEASLVKALEEKGIGRPSTYSPTISTIIDRGYIRREKKLLMPTELGQIVTKIMKDHFPDIVNVEFTAEMEEELDDIEEGEKSCEKLLNEFYGPFMDTLKTAESSMEKIQIADEVSDVPCDKCGAMMVIKLGRFGKFLACPNFPECRNTKPLLEVIDAACPKCGAKLLKRRAKKSGRAFYGCEKYPECDFVSWDLPLKEKCPQCGGIMVAKTGKQGRMTACADKECGYTSVIAKQAADEDA